MVFLFELISPGCDLDGDEWSISATSRADAEARVDARLVETFGAASPERRAKTWVRLVGTRSSKTAPLATFFESKVACVACGFESLAPLAREEATGSRLCGACADGGRSTAA